MGTNNQLFRLLIFDPRKLALHVHSACVDLYCHILYTYSVLGAGLNEPRSIGDTCPVICVACLQPGAHNPRTRVMGSCYNMYHLVIV